MYQIVQFVLINVRRVVKILPIVYLVEEQIEILILTILSACINFTINIFMNRCLSGYYDANVSGCFACSYLCATCENTPTNCLSCRGVNRDTYANNPLCVYLFYYNHFYV